MLIVKIRVISEIRGQKTFLNCTHNLQTKFVLKMPLGI